MKTPRNVLFVIATLLVFDILIAGILVYVDVRDPRFMPDDRYPDPVTSILYVIEPVGYFFIIPWEIAEFNCDCPTVESKRRVLFISIVLQLILMELAIFGLYRLARRIGYRRRARFESQREDKEAPRVQKDGGAGEHRVGLI